MILSHNKARAPGSSSTCQRGLQSGLPRGLSAWSMNWFPRMPPWVWGQPSPMTWGTHVVGDMRPRCWSQTWLCDGSLHRPGPPRRPALSLDAEGGCSPLSHDRAFPSATTPAPAPWKLVSTELFLGDASSEFSVNLLPSLWE